MTKPGMQVLALLRTDPKKACSSWGFRVDSGVPCLSGHLGGSCALTCEWDNGAYKIIIDPIGARDWYIPYRVACAAYCDVSRGEPNGTLVVTFPMNGCALEVRRKGNKNRFYHDADGKSMSPLGTGQTPLFRVDYAGYSGLGEVVHAKSNTIHHKFLKQTEKDPDTDKIREIPVGYGHALFCIKSGSAWLVYQSATLQVSVLDPKHRNKFGQPTRCLKSFPVFKHRFSTKGPPAYLGRFDD
jgi:hypothetical protein